MYDLPELPFEKMLSYLSLEDRLKARAVSRVWYHRINRFKAKSLCFSERPRGFIFQKSRWASGAFAQNFISSSRFDSFFNTFRRSILSNLKNLRLCDLRLMAKSTALTQLNSFGQLEELTIIRLNDWRQGSGLRIQLKLHLPLLASIHLEQVDGIKQLTLDAPRLTKLKLKEARLRVDLVHGESVERLNTDCFGQIDVKNLKNLEFLSCNNLPLLSPRPFSVLYTPMFDSTFLSGLHRLKEVHVYQSGEADNLWEQKQRYGRVDLKIYLLGILLDDPDDPDVLEIRSPHSYPGLFARLVRNRSRLAEEIAFGPSLDYREIEFVRQGSEIAVLRRCPDLHHFLIKNPVQDVQYFLGLFLKDFENIVQLSFSCDQWRELFEWLPEYCAVQRVSFTNIVPDLEFLLSLKHLIWLHLDHSVNAETARRIIEHLEFLTIFKFKHLDKLVDLEIRSSNQFEVSIDDRKKRVLPNLDAAIEFIFENKHQDPAPESWFECIINLLNWFNLLNW